MWYAAHLHALLRSADVDAHQSQPWMSLSRGNTTSFLRGASVSRTHVQYVNLLQEAEVSQLFTAFVLNYPMPQKRKHKFRLFLFVCEQLMSTLCAEAPSCVTLFCPDKWHFCIFPRAVSGMAFARYLWAKAIAGDRVTLPAQKLWYSTLQRLVGYSQGHACLLIGTVGSDGYVPASADKQEI